MRKRVDCFTGRKETKLTGEEQVECPDGAHSHSELVRKFPHALPNLEKWAQKYGIYKL